MLRKRAIAKSLGHKYKGLKNGGFIIRYREGGGISYEYRTDNSQILAYLKSR